MLQNIVGSLNDESYIGETTTQRGHYCSTVEFIDFPCRQLYFLFHLADQQPNLRDEQPIVRVAARA